MEGIQPFLFKKLHSKQSLIEQVSAWKSMGLRVGFTNGVFDLLHPGHVNYLQDAASRVDHLVLGLNSDTSVRRLGKGPDRPINNEFSRSIVLAGLDSISAVCIFEEDTPEDLIKAIQPDMLFKGGDYDPAVSDPKDKRYIVGSDLVKSKGGSVQSIPLVTGFSTTGTLKKIKKDGH
jgi:D-beta-D-heptose 7-phosphate kinase/D-beta-D-heptose 1-phosphate adenosyltransferase